MAKAKTGSGKRRGTRHRSHNYGQQLFDDALSVAGALVRSQKSFGAERLQSFAEATREYAQSLADIPSAQNYVTLAAESVDALADYVDETNLDEMVSDATAFARRQPLAMMFIALSLGLIGTLAVRNQGFGRARSSSRGSHTARTSSTGARNGRRSAASRKHKSSVHANGAGHSAANG